MGAVLTSIPLCSRAGEQQGEADKRPEDRQPQPQPQSALTVVAQPQSVQLQSNTSETCTATGIDNENHQEIAEEDVEQLDTPALEEAAQQLQEEDDGNVEVSLDDSQSDEWSLEKEGEEEGESDSQEHVEE